MVAKRGKDGRAVPITSEEFFERCRKKHDNLYDYSSTVYLGMQSNITINCPSHKTFTTKAKNHIAGVGCPECSLLEKNKKRTMRECKKFLEKSKEVHGDYYNYDKVVYIKTTEDVVITCPVHGDFKQRPANHKSGAGCHKCSKLKSSSALKLTPDQIIQRSYDKFGVSFEFDFSNYVNCKSPIGIKCPIHGWFEDKIVNHLDSEDGCKECFSEKIKISPLRTSVEDNMITLKKLYKDKYHFFQEDITTRLHKVRYYCFKHKKLYSTRLGHLVEGHACPSCGQEEASEKLTGKYNKKIIERSSEFFKKDPNNVYLFKLDDTRFKIGMAKEVIHRGQSIKSSTDYTPTLIYSKSGSTYTCFYLEQRLHEMYKPFRFYSETPWKGHTEVFTLSTDQVQDVINIIEKEVL